MPIKDLFIVFQFIVVTHYYHIMSCAIFQYKLCFTVHKVLNNIAPLYLNSLFHIYTVLQIYIPSNDSLRSALDKLKIATNQCCDNSISAKMCTGITWNSLPLDLRAYPKLKTFRKNLKTFYFKIANKR